MLPEPCVYVLGAGLMNGCSFLAESCPPDGLFCSEAFIFQINQLFKILFLVSKNIFHYIMSR